MNESRKPFPADRSGGGSWFGRTLAAVSGAVIIVLALMFSMVVLAVAAVVGAIILAWLWWHTRRLEDELQQHIGQLRREAQEDRDSGTTIDGTATRIDDRP